MDITSIPDNFLIELRSDVSLDVGLPGVLLFGRLDPAARVGRNRTIVDDSVVWDVVASAWGVGNRSLPKEWSIEEVVEPDSYGLAMQ